MRHTLLPSAYALLPLLAAFGQSSTPTPSFEVASVKLNTSGDRGCSMNSNKGEMFVRNCTLKNVIQNAYNVREYSFTGPDWLADVRLDIAGRLPASDAEETSRERRNETRRLMLQNLLAERFKLECHRETKTMSGYALLVGKKGPRLKETERKDGGSSTSQNNTVLEATGISLEQLANVIGGELHGPVKDMTGLDGKYDLKLEWSHDETPGAGKDEGKSTDTRPSIFTALQETLGLRLETRKVPVEMLVVDRIEKTPTEN